MKKGELEKKVKAKENLEGIDLERTNLKGANLKKAQRNLCQNFCKSL